MSPLQKKGVDLRQMISPQPKKTWQVLSSPSVKSYITYFHNFQNMGAVVCHKQKLQTISIQAMWWQETSDALLEPIANPQLLGLHFFWGGFESVPDCQARKK